MGTLILKSTLSACDWLLHMYQMGKVSGAEIA